MTKKAKKDRAIKPKFDTEEDAEQFVKSAQETGLPDAEPAASEREEKNRAPVKP
jgi:hypothetical protein